MTDVALPEVHARVAPYPPPPLTRWGITWRYLVASAMSVYMAFNMAVIMVGAGAGPLHLSRWVLLGWIVLELAGLAASIVLIRYRRRWPRPIAFALIMCSWVSVSAWGFVAWGYVSLATRLRWREIGAPAALWAFVSLANPMMATTVANLMMGAPAWVLIMMLGFMIASDLLGIAIYTALGFGIGSQRRDVAVARERAEQAVREQSLRVAQGQAAERARIAREMHDVVAHRISLVAMHSGALAYRTDLPPEQMRDVARGIQENATSALTELRAVLAELREDAQPSAPQPSLPDVGTLLQGFRDEGMRVEVTGQLDDVSTMASTQSRHAYRIIQESLTNARKHAVNAPVHLHVEGSPAAGLTIEVRNPKTYTSSVPGGGMGLVGLAERAELAGGRMWSGTERGDFVVKAWLPWSK